MNIILASSTSENKKRYAEEKIRNFLIENGVDHNNINLSTDNIYTVKKEILETADLVVAIGSVPEGISTKVIDGKAFIARIPSMENSVCREILSYVNGFLD